MYSPLPTNVDLLIYLANDSGHTYHEAYTIWCYDHTKPDAYLITETILYLSRQYRLPVIAAKTVYEEGPNSEFIKSRLQ